jgi:hypothetical protein
VLARQLASRAVPLADQHTDQFANGRHFVTVLIADDTPEDVPQSLAAELRRLDIGGQEIGFRLLVVGSAEEAVAAAVLNDEIQACIIRRDLTLRAAVRLGDHPHLTRQNRTQLLQSVAFTPGTGKTHLAIGLAMRACQAGHRVLFATAAEWVARLAEAHHAGRIQAELTRLGRYPLIVVDLCRSRNYADVVVMIGLGSVSRRRLS